MKDDYRLVFHSRGFAMKLSEQQRIYLVLIHDHTERDWATGEIKRFFSPPEGLKISHSETLRGEIFVDGSGVAASLKSLERKGLIEKPRGSWSYCYAITEDGLKEVVRMQETDTLPRIK